ncbi:MAG: hypothetical protein Q8Q59_07885 [Luteolibacter sp.]|nr:hypothetical protein [Luteolibacter sp.]
MYTNIISRLPTHWLKLALLPLFTCQASAGTLSLTPGDAEPQWNFRESRILRSAVGERFVRLEDPAGKMAILTSPAFEMGGLRALDVAFSYRTGVSGSRSDYGAWVMVNVLDGAGKQLTTLKVLCPPSTGWNALHQEFALPPGAAKATAQFRLQGVAGRFDLKQIKLLTRDAADREEIGIPLVEVEKLTWNRGRAVLESPKRKLPALPGAGAASFPWPGSRVERPLAVYEIEAEFTVGAGAVAGKSEALFTMGLNMNGSEPSSITLMLWGGKTLFARLSSDNTAISSQVIKPVPDWLEGQKHSARVRFSSNKVSLWVDGLKIGDSHLAQKFSPVADRSIFIGRETASDSVWSGGIDKFTFSMFMPSVQAAFPSGRGAGTFTGPGPHEWSLDFPEGVGASVASNFHIEDIHGKPVGRPFAPRERSAKSHRVVLPSLPYGSYRLHADLRVNGTKASASRSFAIVNPWKTWLPASQSWFGVQREFSMIPGKFDASIMRTNLACTAAAGSRWFRLWLRWDDIERKPGVYDWDALDQTVAAAREAGVTLLVCITGGALPFQTTEPTKKETWQMMTTACYAPADMGLWSDFLTAMARRYQGKLHYYQIWNEAEARNGLYPFSPKTYADILKASAAAIRAADPNIKIVLGALGDTTVDRTEGGTAMTSYAFAGSLWDAPSFFALKPQADYDIADSHFYSVGEPGQSWDRVKTLAEGVIGFMKKIGEGHKPFWNTETSMYSGKVGENGGWGGVPYLSEDGQASELVKLHVQSLATGIERTFWYGLIGSTGFFNEDLSPKASFTAHVNLVRQLQGARFVKESKLAPNLRVYEFAVDGRSLVAIWSTDSPIPVRIRPANDESWTECDLYGNERKAAAGAELLEAAFRPRFLLSKSPLNVETLVRIEAATPAETVNLRFINPADSPTLFTYAVSAGDQESPARTITVPAYGESTATIPLPSRVNPVRVEALATGGIQQMIELETSVKF